jgi:mono/diheme cytochrome c family protein
MACRSTAIHIFAGLACLTLGGCKVQPPGGAETSSMQWVKRAVTVGGKHDKNPVPDTTANVRAGKQTFGFYCVECHGRDGQNTGVPFAAKMSPPVPSLASADVQKYTDGQLKWIIDNGLSPSGMPASKGTLSDDDIWHIVLYIRHLPRAGSLGEPSAYTRDEYESGPSQQQQ